MVETARATAVQAAAAVAAQNQVTNADGTAAQPPLLIMPSQRASSDNLNGFQLTFTFPYPQHVHWFTLPVATSVGFNILSSISTETARTNILHE